MIGRRFSPSRCWAMVVKELVQMRRDRLTFGMMIGIPLMQLVLFGFAINADPKHLPTAVLLADDGPQGRTLLEAIRNSSYFDFVRQVKTEEEANDALAVVRPIVERLVSARRRLVHVGERGGIHPLRDQRRSHRGPVHGDPLHRVAVEARQLSVERPENVVGVAGRRRDGLALQILG